jgi:hypothetical protein
MTRFVRPSITTSIVVALLSSAAPLLAQTAADAPAPPATGANQISTSPFLVMFTWYNVEYERRANPALAVGAWTSHIGAGGFGYTIAGGFVRFYPQRRAVSGFYLGGRFGLHHVSDDAASDNFNGAGFELGYNWVIGKRPRLLVGLGVGATRLFGGSLSGVPLTIPTARLANIGIVF